MGKGIGLLDRSVRSTRSCSAGMTRVELVIIVVIVLLGLGFLFPLIFQQRVQSQIRFCEKRQVDIYFATRRFESVAGELPSYRVNVAGPGGGTGICELGLRRASFPRRLLLSD